MVTNLYPGATVWFQTVHNYSKCFFWQPIRGSPSKLIINIRLSQWQTGSPKSPLALGTSQHHLR